MPLVDFTKLTNNFFFNLASERPIFFIKMKFKSSIAQKRKRDIQFFDMGRERYRLLLNCFLKKRRYE